MGVGLEGKDKCTEQRIFQLTLLVYRKIQVQLHKEFGPIVQSNSPGFESSFQDQEVR